MRSTHNSISIPKVYYYCPLIIIELEFWRQQQGYSAETTGFILRQVFIDSSFFLDEVISGFFFEFVINLQHLFFNLCGFNCMLILKQSQLITQIAALGCQNQQQDDLDYLYGLLLLAIFTGDYFFPSFAMLTIARVAAFLKIYFILWFSRALAQKKYQFLFLAYDLIFASGIIALSFLKSYLFPMRITLGFVSQLASICSAQYPTVSKVSGRVTSNTIRITSEFLQQSVNKDRYFSCPAVSQISIEISTPSSV